MFAHGKHAPAARKFEPSIASGRRRCLPCVANQKIISWKKKKPHSASENDVMTSMQKMVLSAWHASFERSHITKCGPHRTLPPISTKKKKSCRKCFPTSVHNLLATTSRMVSFKLAAVLLAATADSASASLRNRRLSSQAIAGYEPGSSVTDHVSLFDLNWQLTKRFFSVASSHIMQ